MLLKSPTECPISFGTKTGSGHSMVLDSNGADVPQMFIQAAFAAGAIPVGEEEAAFVSSPVDTKTKSANELIIDGIKTMLERKSDNDFTDRRVLSKVVGLNVTAEDLAVAWKTLNESV